MAQILFDLLPVLAFFVAFKFAGVYAATAIGIAATFLQLAWLKVRRQKIPAMQWVSLALIVVFGGLTLVLKDERFIKFKPSLLYWLMAGAMWASWRFWGINVLQRLMGQKLTLPDAHWRRLQVAWMSFFIFLGALNLLVAHWFSTDAWVNFKLFGIFGLLLVFIVAQSLWLARAAGAKDGHSTQQH